MNAELVPGREGFNGSKLERGPPLDDPNLAIIAALVCAANILLLLILLYTYVGSYRKLKSQFSLGLAIFTTLLIVQNIMFLFFLLAAEGFHGPGMGFPVLSLSIIEFGALLVLLKITWI
jgi:hypothetical protein